MCSVVTSTINTINISITTIAITVTLIITYMSFLQLTNLLTN